MDSNILSMMTKLKIIEKAPKILLYPVVTFFTQELYFISVIQRY